MPSNLDTVLITGGAGYIGSVAAATLLRKGYRVRVLDNLTFGGAGVLPLLTDPGYSFVRGDIRSRQDLDTALQGVRAVVHLAALVGDPACRTEPQAATEINQLGSELLIQSACRHRVERFVFASTCSNYGRMPDPEGYVDEDSPLNPISHYAELKVGFENYLLALDSDATVPTILRFATAYGLSPRPRFDLTVNEFTKELYLKRRLEIYGEQFWRPYCHVCDLSEAVVAVLAADRDKVGYEAFNVGRSDQNYRKKDIVDTILAVLPDRAHLIERVRREEDPRDYRVRFDKIETTLGFQAARAVPDGVAEIIRTLDDGIIGDPDAARYRNT